MTIYEGMFIINAAEASRDWDAAQAKVTDMLVRNGAEIKRAEKWADRKLAYDIAGQSKGVYLLVYFDAPPENMRAIRGDCRLQRDHIVRELFIKKDESALDKPTYSDSEVAASEKARRMTSRSRPDSENGEDSSEDNNENEESSEQEEEVGAEVESSIEE